MYDTRTLQLCILDMAIEFRRICEKYNLRYSLIGGSLLGAVRGGGFIPWDDDMDMGMPRADYERFLEIAPGELGSEYFLQTYESDPSYAFGFAKIRINGTKLIEDYTVESAQHNGIFLDVFPLDRQPRNAVAARLRYIAFKGVKWAALGHTDYHFVVKKRRYFAALMSHALCFLSKDTLCRLLDRICCLYEDRDFDEYINLHGAYHMRDTITRAQLEDLTGIDFEGYEFCAPADYDAVLRHIYGDYMQLPPEDERGHWHEMLEMDPGDYVPHNHAPRAEARVYRETPLR